MSKNIAVVGCGHWGKNLVRNFSELGSLAAVCDPDIEVAENYASKYSVDMYTFSEVNSDPNIEGVVLAVPAPLHASMAIEAMNSGKHVYVEKPIAMNESEAKEMQSSSKENNVHLMVGHLLQYHPIFKTVCSIVRSGKIGALSYIYSNRLSFGKVRAEEDVIWSFAPHDISMILSLTEKKPLIVNTESSAILQPDIADTAIVHIEFDSGLKAHISVSWLHPYKEQKLVIIGESAMIVFDDTKSWKEKLALYPHVIEQSSALPKLGKSDVEYIDVPESEPLRNECQHFMEVVNGNSNPLTDGDEGLRVLEILSAASLSQSRKEKVKIGML